VEQIIIIFTCHNFIQIVHEIKTVKQFFINAMNLKCVIVSSSGFEKVPGGSTSVEHI